MIRYVNAVFWFVLALLSSTLACSSSSSRVVAPVPPGTLQEPLSLHVTSSKKPSVLFNEADFAQLLYVPTRRNLQARSFQLEPGAAPQQLVVHVREAGRGSGNVRFFCDLEVYVYQSLRGPLDFDRGVPQNEVGAVSGERPLFHKSLRIENHRRGRAEKGGELKQGAEYCAEQLAEELARVRNRAPALRPAPSRRAPGRAVVKKPAPASSGETSLSSGFEVVHRLDVAPGNLTLTPQGRIIVSLHQFFEPKFAVAEVDENGELREFAKDAHLDSVLGVQSDENGVVWLLDNGMKSTHRARLVGYHSVREKVVADIELTHLMPKDAFANDLVIDLDHEFAYLADPAGGKNAALVVVDLKSGKGRRLLEGHSSVVPEDVDLVVEGAPLEIERPDGTVLRPRVGLNPIAADKHNEWLYFGPMHGTSLYRIATAALRDETLSANQLAAAVDRFSDRPITDGISIDDEGNVYLADLPNNAVVRVAPSGEMTTIASGVELSWVDAFSFGPDGHLYAVVNQLHRSALLNRGKDVTIRPFLIIKIPTDVGGTVGR